MGNVVIIKKLKTDIEFLLAKVSSDTFEESYESLTNLLLNYKGLVTKEDVYSLFRIIENESVLNLGQEEVLWEISNRLSGNCRIDKVIEL